MSKPVCAPYSLGKRRCPVCRSQTVREIRESRSESSSRSGPIAQHGILVKGGGEAFQEASDLDVMVFDKTGTLTEGGSPKVMDHVIMASREVETKVVWAIAQALEESGGDHEFVLLVFSQRMVIEPLGERARL